MPTRNFSQVLECVGYKELIHINDETNVLESPTAEQLTDANPDLGGGGSGTLTALTVAQLQALAAPVVATLNWVYDATYGLGAYRFSADADATSAPTFYRADDDTGVWSKVL